MTTIFDAVQKIGQQSRQASRLTMRASSAQKDLALRAMAEVPVRLNARRVKAANKLDVEAAQARALEPVVVRPVVRFLIAALI